MLSLYSKIINAPIVELRTQTQVGIVNDLIIHKTKLEVYGIVLKRESLLSFIQNYEERVIMNTDILELNSGAVIISNADSVVPIGEAIRLKEAIDQKYSGIYQKVISKKGKSIGLVYDYLVDSTTQRITKFYCRTLFTERIISDRSIIKIEGKRIFIKDDDLETQKITTPAIESSLV